MDKKIIEQNGLIRALTKVSQVVGELESRAHDRLHGHDDPQASANLLHKKAEILADLPRIAAPHLWELTEVDRFEIQERLEEFAASARRSLEIGSVFYMANLLYDEDHKSGEPNNLDALIREIQSSPLSYGG
jgi:hypothetical protein